MRHAQPHGAASGKASHTVSFPIAAVSGSTSWFDALAAFSKLRDEYAAGHMTPAEYRAALEKIRVHDAAGRHWAIDGQSGIWLLWNGTGWVPANPLL